MLGNICGIHTERCPVGSRMTKQFDFVTEIRKRVHVSRDECGEIRKVHFQPKLFSFLCSSFDIFQSYVNVLNCSEMNACVPEKNHWKFDAFLAFGNRIVCPKNDRLDIMVDYMNDDLIQKMVFQDLIPKLLKNESSECSDMKSWYTAAVAKLSSTCNKDGTRALMEVINEMLAEFQNAFVGIIEDLEYGVVPENLCLDDIKEAASCALRSMS
ncbi:uncharacterized protein LOC125653808 isoform X3 [Ostrea edulis]|nr:uncharacterized protein LOC125653808 isoform X3 [Ostrea edulis]